MLHDMVNIILFLASIEQRAKERPIGLMLNELMISIVNSANTLEMIKGLILITIMIHVGVMG